MTLKEQFDKLAENAVFNLEYYWREDEKRIVYDDFVQGAMEIIVKAYALACSSDYRYMRDKFFRVERYLKLKLIK